MNTINPKEPTSIFDITAKLVMEGSKNIFLTGKAGTGKTTFLKYIRENCSKNLAVVAPTGVAAINAGGVTIHSFFQIPFSPFVPTTGYFSSGGENVNSYLSRLKLRGEKKKILRELELLIIDEVSMVRCDILDAIDAVLRFIRRRPAESFGGVQMLFIGDLFQLPPVVKDTEWTILNSWYNSPYFFESLALKKSDLLSIEFDKIYRQSDSAFIGLLNRVRNNCLDEECRTLLDKLYKPAFDRRKNGGFIILTTHNDKARKINQCELTALNSKQFIYKAEIENDFPENAFPVDVSLELKVGAQVMFVKNDSGEKGKRYYNGKIGTVTLLEADKILVKCEEEENHIEVKREKWDNIRYVLNHSSREIEEEVLGSFSQFPLRLAWAITIHKSQGLTFEKAIIDAGHAFAPGQVYVALSRCTSMEGIVLLSKIPISGLANDPTILKFSTNKTGREQLENEASVAAENFRRQSLISTFQFNKPLSVAAELQEYIRSNEASFEIETGTWMDDVFHRIEGIEQTAEKFRLWLQQNFESQDERNQDLIQDKTKKAVPYFLESLNRTIELLEDTAVQTDSYLHAREFNDNVKEMLLLLHFQKHLIESCRNGFDVEEWQKQKKNFKQPEFNINAHSLSSNKKINGNHPKLQQQLRRLRDQLCQEYDLPVFRIAKNKSIEEIAEKLPQNHYQLEQISGFGKMKVRQFGNDFLSLVKSYCSENNIEISEAAASAEQAIQPTTKKKKGSSPLQTFNLYLAGKTVEEIAAERNFAPTTIEGHLAQFVITGALEVSRFLDQDKLEKIERFYHHYDGKTLKSIKDHLPEISFSEIRFFISHKQFLENKQSAKVPAN